MPETTIQSIVKELEDNHWQVPQPEGTEIAVAYDAEEIPSSGAAVLHVYAVMLRKIRDLENPCK